MERMLIKHLSGSKANQVEEFALKYHNELILGREEGSTVKYDPDRDDLVGRQHAKISRDPSDANGFLLSDLNSRNGTFLNKQRISGTVKLRPGDLVQFGPGGPEFQFDVEPRPAGASKATRIAEVSGMGKSSPETRQVITNVSGSGSNSIPTAPAASMTKPPGTVGKATVERMISHTVSETKKSQGRKFGLIGGAAALAVLILFGVVIGGAYYYNSRQQKQNEEATQKAQEAAQQAKDEAASKQAALEKQMADEKANAGISSSEITAKYGDAVVYIEHTWHLFDGQSKSQLYHQYVPNDTRVLAAILKVSPPKVPSKINPEAGSVIPVYLAVVGSDNKPTYEPMLTTSKETNGVENQAIGSQLRGTGFFVTSNGFILTNRHIGETWKTWYQFNPQTTPLGIILNPDGTLASNSVPPPHTWVPSETKQSGKQYTGAIMGTTDSMTVTLNGKENRVNAKLVQSSDRHDVSLLKIDVAGEETKVELNDNYDSLKKGEQVTIMGYPAASPEVVGVSTSKDPFHSDASVLSIPQLTVTDTNISNILRGSEKDADNKTYSIMGDVIQLATNATGPGNSGGPVFDSQGKVIGIFFAGSSGGGAAITYAVPIRFGMELIK
ncbi:MAG: trypsin-like peptidase domain-containing protein [Pyrinomonadaceae bacterium]